MSEKPITNQPISRPLLGLTTLLVVALSLFPSLPLAILTASLVIILLVLQKDRVSTNTTLLIWGSFFLLSALIGLFITYTVETGILKFSNLSISFLFGLILLNQKNQSELLWSLLGFGSVLIALSFVASKFISFSDPILVTPNRLAGLSAVLLPFLALTWLNCKNNLNRLIVGIGVLFSIVILILTGSRGAIAAWLLGMFLWWLYGLDKLSHRKILIWSILLIGFSAGIAFIIFSPQLSESFINTLPSADTRLELYTNSRYLINDYWLLGSGLNSFGGNYSQYIESVPFLIFTYGHNLLIDLWLELGILGLISFATLQFTGFYSILNSSQTKKHAAGAILASGITLIFHGLIDDSLFGDIGSPLLLIPSALALSVAHHELVFRRSLAFSISGVALCLFMISGPIQPSFRANFAAVEMNRVLLSTWPTNEWSRGEHGNALQSIGEDMASIAEKWPEQVSVHYRLGLISLERKEFDHAVEFLQSANQHAPNHPGIKKNYGYALLWSGDVEAAAEQLQRIKGIPGELDAYIWWWIENEEKELSDLAKGLRDKPIWE